MNADDGIVRKLYRAGKLNVEQEFAKDVHFEVLTGSTSYGMNTNTSDNDVVGICIPPIDFVFPYRSGEYIEGFGPTPPKFENFQQHHIELDDKEYDITVYSIIKFFQLAADNNPNIIDLLYVEEKFITHTDNIGKLIRQNRNLFLTKNSFHRFKGYAYAQMKKMKAMNVKDSRKELFEKYGFDTKHASHIFRLALECEMILTEQNLDLTRNSELLKSVRRGDWKLEDIEIWFREKELHLNKLYTESTLRYSPDWGQLKQVLLCCLEEKYGNLNNLVNSGGDGRLLRKFEQIKQIVNS